MFHSKEHSKEQVVRSDRPGPDQNSSPWSDPDPGRNLLNISRGFKKLFPKMYIIILENEVYEP